MFKIENVKYQLFKYIIYTFYKQYNKLTRNSQNCIKKLHLWLINKFQAKASSHKSHNRSSEKKKKKKKNEQKGVELKMNSRQTFHRELADLN